mmetsp:Transcript_24768/g.60259  ORF Transcript_24768/g.60259 Transcript_24768/m.60259 type:complete len:154 (-) Transcript_24768:39-500(-)
MYARHLTCHRRRAPVVCVPMHTLRTYAYTTTAGSASWRVRYARTRRYATCYAASCVDRGWRVTTMARVAALGGARCECELPPPLRFPPPPPRRPHPWASYADRGLAVTTAASALHGAECNRYHRHHHRRCDQVLLLRAAGADLHGAICDRPAV